MKDKCKLCKKEEKLVDSHIIPQSFFNVIAPDNDSRIIDNQKSHPKRCPSGVYDQIACNECENLFALGDDYIKKFFTNKDFSRTLNIGNMKGHVIEKFDLDKINEFIAALLWRSSVSSQDFYERVNVGKKYERLLRKYIMSDEKFPSQIQYIFKKYDKVHNMLCPVNMKMEGLNAYNFHFGEWHIYIKVDQRNFSGVLSEFADHSKEVWVMKIPYIGSPAHTAALKLAKQNKHFFDKCGL